MTNAAATTTMGAAPAFSIPIAASCALPAVDQRAGQPPGQRGDISLCGADADHQPEGDNPGQPRHHRPGTRGNFAAVGSKADHGLSLCVGPAERRGPDRTRAPMCALGPAPALEEKWRTPGDSGAAVAGETLVNAAGRCRGRELS